MISRDFHFLIVIVNGFVLLAFLLLNVVDGGSFFSLCYFVVAVTATVDSNFGWRKFRQK